MDQSIENAADSAMPGQSDAWDVEAVYVRIAKRLMPFLLLLFLMAWLDRVNVGFAKLQMVKDLGFSGALGPFCRRPAQARPRQVSTWWSDSSSLRRF